MSEWDFDGSIAPGASGRRVRLVQEWLYLQDIKVVIDGKYGPATTAAVRQFQTRNGLGSTGTVNQATFAALLAPLRQARQALPVKNALGKQVLAYANQHLDQRPCEVGGQNMGPWVRLYMAGNQGAQWPWCAGFASFVLRQAADTLGVPMPVDTSFSCDLLAADAQRRGSFLPESQVRAPGDIPTGSLFLSRRTGGDWTHTGIVVSAGTDTFVTIEGNTNDAGDREGYEVCRRLRGFKDKDFIVIS